MALRNGTNLRYIHQDSLGSTSVVTDSSGAQYGYTRYYPYGSTRDSGGSLDTSKKFTGQRLDGTGLYYYGARYYDPTIGRFISADTIVPNFTDPQSLNRYSYCLNNPLKYIDPTGHGWPWDQVKKIAKEFFGSGLDALQTGLDVVGLIPGVGEPADALNGVIYAARGDELNAGLSFAACVPVAGSLATVGKLVNKGDNLVDAGRGIIKEAEAASNTLKGTRNPVVRNAIDTGKRAHNSIEKQLKEQGYRTERGIRLGNNKKVRVDAINGNHIIEIKPNTPSGIMTGEARRAYLQQYGYDVDIYYYNPADF